MLFVFAYYEEYGDKMIIESYISMWNKIPNDAMKVRVARPSVLSASKEL